MRLQDPGTGLKAKANILLGLFSALLAGMMQLWMRSLRGLFVTVTYLREAQGGELCYASHPPMLRGSGATRIVEDINEERGRVSPVPPEDDLTGLAVTWTPQRPGVRK
jgi:hypothetical protein